MRRVVTAMLAAALPLSLSAFVPADGGGTSTGDGTAAGGGAGGEYAATIVRTEHSIPHITADDYGGLGYGVGYAQAEDNFCLLAAIWTRLEGKAALHRGRDLGPARANDDLYHTYINETVDFDALMTQPPPHGPTQDTIDLVDGYVAGYNAYLAEHGVDGIPDEGCRGGTHIRPIDRVDLARRMYDLIGLGGRDLVRSGMLKASPPGLTDLPNPPSALADATTPTLDPDDLAALADRWAERVENGGSNAVGLGSDATDNGSGLLLANPHWTWDGQSRFWQMHVQIPGTVHVSGMGFIGQPLVMIGHNEHVAWSHTVSAARRLALAELKLVPGSPTRYVVDGQVLDMEATPITIQVREDDGSITERSHTFHSSIYGPVTNTINGLEILPWTQERAYSMVDMNTGSVRIANQFMETHLARSAEELYEVHAKYVGNPWATTTVADDQGNTLWTDVGTVPNISNVHASQCNTALGHALWNTFAVAVLDGSRSTCDVPTAPDSVAPKTMPADLQPVQRRTDYVVNSNESHWLTNAYEPLEGYSRVFGPERSQRSMRTRLGHRLILDRLEGLDGAGKTTFGRQDLQDLLFGSRNLLGDLWADDLADACEAAGRFPNSAGQEIDVRAACPVLRDWGRTNSLDDPGAVLFYRFSDLSGIELEWTTSYIGLPSPQFWREQFLVTDPVDTPSGLNPGYGLAYSALADAVQDLQQAGIPLDATMRDYQLSRYGRSRAPLHGGKGTLGLFNALNVGWAGDHIRAGGGGPSFLQVTQFSTDGSCPDVRTLLNGSQRSEHAWDRADEQQLKYSAGVWVDPPFCDDELAAAPRESITRLRDGEIVHE
jgi:acyl-homoserine-lactone acylase